MNSLRDVFKFRIRQLRGNRSQEEFAATLDLSLRSYQNLETGVVPQKKTLDQIVEKLGLQSETALFLDPDLIAPPTPMEALRVITQTIQKVESEHVSPKSKQLIDLILSGALDETQTEVLLDSISAFTQTESSTQRRKA